MIKQNVRNFSLFSIVFILCSIRKFRIQIQIHLLTVTQNEQDKTVIFTFPMTDLWTTLSGSDSALWCPINVLSRV